MANANIYEEILANIDAEKTAWCKGEYEERVYDHEKEEHVGPVLSRCLVGHVDYATGVSYVRGNGKQFRSVSPKKWRRRNAILRHLVDAMTPKMREKADPWDVNNIDVEDDNASVETFIRNLKADEHYYGTRVGTTAESVVVNFNDHYKTGKQHVKALLKRAAKLFPED